MWTIVIAAATLACNDTGDIILETSTLPVDYHTITCIPEGLYESDSTEITLANMTSLRVIEPMAFKRAGTTASTIDLTGATALTTVDSDAFYEFKGVVRMETNTALIRIGAQAFYYASSNASTIDLTEATNLTFIEYEAFREFEGKVTMGNNTALETIGIGAFYGASSASTIDLRGATNLATVDSEAFNEFEGIVTMANNTALIRIGDGAFYLASSDSTIDLTGATKLTTVDNSAFQEFKGEVTMGDNPALNTIGDSAFYKASSDSTIDLTGATALTTVDEFAFQEFAGEVTMAGSYPLLETIESAVFYKASNPNSTIDLSQATNLTTIKGCRVCTEDYETHFGAFEEFVGKVTIFNTLVLIESRAFYSASNKESVVNLTGAAALTDVGHFTGAAYGAFEDFRGDVHMGANTALETIKTWAFAGDTSNPRSVIDLRGATALATIDNDAFNEFRGEVQMGNNPALETIGVDAFYLASSDSTIDLTGATKLTTVDNSAFQEFKGEVTMGDNPALNTIGDSAFYKASSDSTIDLTGATALTTVDEFAFQEFAGEVTMAGSYPLLETIESAVFYKASNPNSTIDLSQATNLTTIKGCRVCTEDYETHFGAFEEFVGKVTIFNTLVLIESRAFYSASNKESVVNLTGAAALTDVGHFTGAAYGAFEDFRGDVHMGANTALETIKTWAFAGASNPRSVIDLTGATNLITVDHYAFQAFNGTVIMVGPYPLLEFMGIEAFLNALHVNNTVTIESCAAGFTFAPNAFAGVTWDYSFAPACTPAPPPAPPPPVSAPSGSPSESASGLSAVLIALAAFGALVAAFFGVKRWNAEQTTVGYLLF